MDNTTIGWLSLIIVGAIAGWLASMVMNTRLGLLTDIVVGIVGAIIGGFIFGMLGQGGVSGINIGSIVIATIGAVVLLAVLRLLSGRPAITS